MTPDFTHTTFGSTGLSVYRLGLSATYRPGKHTVFRAVDEGINLFFGFGIDTQMTAAMREILKRERERFVLVTGVYNLLIGYPDMRRTLEKRLRQFGTEYIDAFLFLGVTKEKQFSPKAQDELRALKGDGKVRFVGMSCHDRKFAGRLAADGALDVFMTRYNAAHRGAEVDIFPHLKAHNPAVLNYTATRWTALLRRPRGWPKQAQLPTPGQCYRFALSNPHVHVCLTAPRSEHELVENVRSLRDGPLSTEEMLFIKQFGDAVYRQYKWFM